jgi:molybdopterin molybdotransferase
MHRNHDRAALHESVDTVVRYEDLEIKDGFASLLTDSITRAQSIHQMGKDRKQQEVVAGAFEYVTPAIISIAASVGASILPVMRLPRTVIISSVMSWLTLMTSLCPSR